MDMREVVKQDDLHIDLSTALGYQRPFTAIISEREPGKSTQAWLVIWNAFKRGYSSIAIRRQVVDVTPGYIDDSLEILNKFCADFEISKISYSKQECYGGVVDVLYDKKRFVRIIGLSKKLSSLKSLFVPKLRYILFDEFIVNNRAGEKYLKNEAFKFKEMFNTFQRESDGHITCLFLGNPYSLYNPYFTWWGVDTKKLKRGTLIAPKDKNYLVWCYEMKPELREAILKRNPLYQFDDDYKNYAFNGMSINDSNIKLVEKEPLGYKLRFAINFNECMLGIYENTNYSDFDNRFFVKKIDLISEKKRIYCFNFNDLIERVSLVSNEDRVNFIKFKDAFRLRQVSFKTIEDYYLIEEIYQNL